MRPVVILAGGQNKCLSELEHSKLLLRVNGEPIVERTIRLVRELTAGLIGVSTSLKLSDVAAQHGFSVWAPHPVMGQSIKQLCEAFSFQGCTVLLGDVVWDKDELKEILEFPYFNFAFRHSRNRITSKQYCEHLGVTLGTNALHMIKDCGTIRDMAQIPGIESKELAGWSDDIDAIPDLLRLPLLSELVRVQDTP